MGALQRDGVSLFYEEAKGAKRPILFMHGWCCDHSFFAPQFEHFAREGHHVIAVDLRVLTGLMGAINLAVRGCTWRSEVDVSP
jgi:pimeloyl-ACP methyl ester carboxylesterase